MCKQCCVALEGCTAPKRQRQHLSLRHQQTRANFIHRQLRYQHCQLLLPHFAEALPQCSTSLGLCHKKGSMYSRNAAERARLSSRNHCLPWPPSTGSCIHYAPSIFLSSFAFYPNHSSIFISYDHSKSPTYSSISPPKYHTSHELGLDAPLEDVGQRKHPSVVSETPIRGFD